MGSWGHTHTHNTDTPVSGGGGVSPGFQGLKFLQQSPQLLRRQLPTFWGDRAGGWRLPGDIFWGGSVNEGPGGWGEGVGGVTQDPPAKELQELLLLELLVKSRCRCQLLLLLQPLLVQVTLGGVRGHRGCLGGVPGRVVGGRG